jgi:hypothetical protein
MHTYTKKEREREREREQANLKLERPGLHSGDLRATFYPHPVSIEKTQEKGFY